MCAKIRQDVPRGMKEMSRMTAAPTGFIPIAKLKVEKKFPKNDQVVCGSPLSIVVVAGEGEFLWWNHPQNRFERFGVKGGDIIDVDGDEGFSLTGELQLFIISLSPQPLIFRSVSID